MDRVKPDRTLGCVMVRGSPDYEDWVCDYVQLDSSKQTCLVESLLKMAEHIAPDSKITSRLYV